VSVDLRPTYAPHSGRKGTKSPQCPSSSSRHTCETRHSSGNAPSGWALEDSLAADHRVIVGALITWAIYTQGQLLL